MKKTLLLVATTLVFNFGFSQEKDISSTLKNVILTLNQISGNADPSRIVKVDIDNDKKPDYSIIVNWRGYFEQTFTTALSPATKISVWTVDEANAASGEINLISESSEDVLNKVKLNSIKLPLHVINPEIDEVQPISSTFKYKVKILNTNFTIPIARFNLTKDDASKTGDILLFNSVGAGLGMSWGELEKTTDATGETINTEFTNTFGFHFGILFSAGSSSTENKNIFAPTFSVSTLDYQVGIGYEMGTLAPNQRKVFFTVAYAIPLSKLLKGKFYIFTASKGYNSKNPLPIDNGSESIRKKVGRLL